MLGGHARNYVKRLWDSVGNLEILFWRSSRNILEAPKRPQMRRCWGTDNIGLLNFPFRQRAAYQLKNMHGYVDSDYSVPDTALVRKAMQCNYAVKSRATLIFVCVKKTVEVHGRKNVGDMAKQGLTLSEKRNAQIWCNEVDESSRKQCRHAVNDVFS